jgi:hypothetical protein
LKITRAGGYSSTPSQLTPTGRAIGFKDARAYPGELDMINCCITHLSFELPAPESPLKVVEIDNAQHAITMAAQTSNLASLEEPVTTALNVFAGAPGVPASGTPPTGTANPGVVSGTKTLCVPRTTVKISLRRPKGVRFVKLVIHISGRKKQIVSGKRLGTKSRTNPVTIKLWKTKTTKVRLVVTTAAGRTLTYKQSYKPCKS